LAAAGYDGVLGWLELFGEQVTEQRGYLTELDSAIGDGDHGTNMNRGMQAALERARAVEERDIGALLRAVAMALISKVGGAAGPLYGSFFLQFSGVCKGKEELSAQEWGEALAAGVASVQARGKAEEGDKTMIDALLPAVRAYQQAVDGEAGFGDALRRSAAAAEQGMQATIALVARKGRASYLGERSRDHQDPGATSAQLLLAAAADALAPSS
jgi:phosphoenolpyruvate---glycerone phosphotransferase subunit DhaL